jgi:predicted metalloprotease
VTTRQAYPQAYPQGYQQTYPQAYPQGYGQTPWGYPVPQPPARKKRTGLRALIVVAIVLCIVGPTLLTAAAEFFGGDEVAPEPPTPTQTAGTGGPTDGPTTEVPAPPTDPGVTSGPRTDEWPIDLNPPALPEPSTWDQLYAYLNDNAFYNQTVAPVPCEVGDVDLLNASVAEVQLYMTGVVACLMDTWDNPVYDAGYQLPRPSITVYDSEIMTKCGESIPQNAFYCGVDQQLYYSYDLATLFSGELRTARYVAEMVIAHEFGHAVQGRTGISTSVDIAQYNAETEEAATELNRRLEVQADCFAGMFLRSIAAATNVTETDAYHGQQVFAELGDPPSGGDHGQSATRAHWFDTGFASTAVGACATYQVAASEVE